MNEKEMKNWLMGLDKKLDQVISKREETRFVGVVDEYKMEHQVNWLVKVQKRQIKISIVLFILGLVGMILG